MKIIFILSFVFLNSCSDSGVQGTNLFSKFQGVSTAESLSPTAIRLTWGLDGKFSEYRIYENEGFTPIKSETFGTTVVSNLQPDTLYYYQISGYSSTTGEEFSGTKMEVRTIKSFSGIAAEGVTLKSGSEIELSWDLNSTTAKYRIFYKNQTGTWNKSLPFATVQNQNKISVPSLVSGLTYCFFIEAEYLDGSIQPVATTENELNAMAKCKQLTTPMVSLPSINVNSITFGDFPWFWTSNGDPSYRTEIYDSTTNTRIASRTGNGYFRSTVNINSINTNYYALVSDSSGGVANVKVDIVGSVTKTNTRTRKMSSSGSNGPIYPPILANGSGPQNLGNQIASGDFNCDGLPDLAVAAKTSVPFNTTEHYTGIGSVTIYYTYEYVEDVEGIPTTRRELKTNVLPSSTAVAPNPQLISYPVTAHLTQIGNKIAVGNFNGDCYQNEYDPLSPNGSPIRGNCDQIYSQFTSQTPQLIRQTKKCDDLAISTTAGSFYIVYGDPNIGLVSGSMSNTNGVDEQTCDSVSSTCRASRYNAPLGFSTSGFARALAVGDFNNDGFDDLAVSATFDSDNIDRILIYRGNSLGIVPHGSANSFALISPLDGSTGLTAPEQISLPGDGFGFSLTAVPNSRQCLKDSPFGSVFRDTTYFPTAASQRVKGLDLSKCADLVIGAPNRAAGRGSIYTCRGTQPTAGDKQLIQSWTCKEHYPNPIDGEAVRGYGYSLLGVANQNGYPIATNVIGATQPNIWGALFVGAPTSTINTLASVGSVYGYYVTKTTGENVIFGIQTAIGASIAHTVVADNSIPCDQSNSTCLIQRIFPSSGQSGMQFGTTLSTINERAGNVDQWMPMLAVGAPFRDNINSLGQIIVDAGAIYLFRGDISNFMNQMDNGVEITEPVYNPAKLTPCSNGNCTWLSGGISPFGETLIYNKDVLTNAQFGIGSAAGFQILSDFSFNDDTSTDIFVSAPFNDSPTPNNGGFFGFYSSAGSFSPTIITPTKIVNTNHSLEGNYKFEEARFVGDINGDGYGDVMSHINNNNNWVVVVYYGSATGLIQSPDPSYNPIGLGPKLFKSIFDSKMGAQIYPIGDLNNDGFADVLILSSNSTGSYIYYGSTSGLVTTVEPDISPIGKNPLRFATNGGGGVTFNTISSSYDSAFSTVESYNNIVQSVTFGKFNNDLYDDIAIRTYSSATLPIAIQNPGLNYTGLGRVFIIYGGSSGPKINTTTGRILLQDGLGNPADVVSTNPCDSLDNSICKIQMLSAPSAGSTAFGYSIAKRSLYNLSLGEYDGLLITDPNYGGTTGRAYVYESEARGLKPVPIQTLTPRDSATRFGYSIVEVGDINGDQKQDIAISSRDRGPSPRAPIVTVYYGKQVSGKSAYAGDSTESLLGTDFWNPVILDNQKTTSLRPQIINPVVATTTDLLGYGLVGFKDINNDGFADLGVNVPNGDYNISGTVLRTGYVLIFFGSANGLQIDTTKITPTPYPRCYSGTTTMCDPYQIYLPGYTENDFTQVNPHSFGDINGDGINDFIIGASGRSHPSGKGISTGVIYVMY